MDRSLELDGDNRPIKSILKKSSTSSSSSTTQNGTKKEGKKVVTRKVSRVNYAFESDENDHDFKTTSTPTVQVVAEVH